MVPHIIHYVDEGSSLCVCVCCVGSWEVHLSTFISCVYVYV